MYSEEEDAIKSWGRTAEITFLSCSKLNLNFKAPSSQCVSLFLALFSPDIIYLVMIKRSHWAQKKSKFCHELMTLIFAGQQRPRPKIRQIWFTKYIKMAVTRTTLYQSWWNLVCRSFMKWGTNSLPSVFQYRLNFECTSAGGPKKVLKSNSLKVCHFKQKR